jgi:hypothetical protein
MSAARLAVSYPRGVACDQPKPRQSGQISQCDPASSGTTCRQAYQCYGKPCSSTTGSPAPASATCSRAPRTSTNRWTIPGAGGNGRPPDLAGGSAARLAG